MRLVGQGDVSFRILDVCLALLQDVLAEAHATAQGVTGSDRPHGPETCNLTVRLLRCNHFY